MLVITTKTFLFPLISCKFCEREFCCIVHQHDRLVTWLQTKNCKDKSLRLSLLWQVTLNNLKLLGRVDTENYRAEES